MAAVKDTRQAVSREILEALTGVSRNVKTVFDARVTTHGLTYPRARILLALSRRSRLAQYELAAELDLKPATTGRLLDRMEELDLIARASDPNDRRIKHIVLTAHGAAQADLVAGIGVEVRQEVFSDISDAALFDVLSILRIMGRNVGEMDARAGHNDGVSVEEHAAAIDA